jgi:hypothetical protein
MSDRGRPIHQDPEAESADPELPAFIARPERKPVDYGFPVLDVEVDGFRLGAISGFAIEELDNPDEDGTWGDAFVIGPDGRRAGLIWEVERGPAFAPAPGEDDDDESLASDERVGVYNVSFPRPMRSLEDARANLAAIVPMLRKEWDR